MRWAIIALGMAMVALAGCAGSASYEGNENSPFYVIPPESQLVLNHEVTIPANAVSIYLQDGRILPFSDVRKYYPHCKFELYSMSNVARQVAPDTFAVTRVMQEESQSADAGIMRYAQSQQNVTMADMGDPGGLPLIAFVTRMYLHSAKQPDVFRMNCAQWGYPLRDRQVTIAEIRRTFSDIFTLRITNSADHASSR